MPNWLTGEARRVWRELVPQLMDLRVLAKIDQAMLATLCQAIADVERTERFIAENGLTHNVNPKGDPSGVRLRPEARELRHAREFVLRACAEFGMTPASRTRIEVSAPPRPDKLTDFLNGQATATPRETSSD
jgi:P27 family predicted phage terminase small subunit